MLMSHHSPQHLLGSRRLSWGTAETVFVTQSGSSAQEFKCHQLDLLHLPLLQELILLGDHKRALWMLSGSSPCMGMLAVRLQLNPDTSSVARKAVGRQQLSSPHFTPQAPYHP